MNPRRLAYRLGLLAVVLVTAWLFTPKPARLPAVPASPPSGMHPAATTADTPPPMIPPAPLAPAVAAGTPATTPSAAPAAVAPATAAAAAAVDQVRLMLRDYRTLTGENPVGTNAEIMQTLMGDNPRQATLGPPEGQTLNDKGELVDRWGTPLFFHQLSKTVMEIRSAGPDRIMWTEDDIVSR